MVLERIHSSEDVKRLSSKELPVLAQELRARIIDSVSRNGGHLASNLGVVELTIALHRAFDFPKDALIFDVGHQCYAHKLLTGRADSFDTLRQFGGLAGFPRREESPYDAFDTGHAEDLALVDGERDLIQNILVRIALRLERYIFKRQDSIACMLGSLLQMEVDLRTVKSSVPFIYNIRKSDIIKRASKSICRHFPIFITSHTVVRPCRKLDMILKSKQTIHFVDQFYNAFDLIFNLFRRHENMRIILCKTANSH